MVKEFAAKPDNLSFNSGNHSVEGANGLPQAGLCLRHVCAAHTYAHTERASGQLAVESCQWSFGAWEGGPGPAGLHCWSAKWAMGIEGHWMGCVHL